MAYEPWCLLFHLLPFGWLYVGYKADLAAVIAFATTLEVLVMLQAFSLCVEALPRVPMIRCLWSWLHAQSRSGGSFGFVSTAEDGAAGFADPDAVFASASALDMLEVLPAFITDPEVLPVYLYVEGCELCYAELACSVYWTRQYRIVFSCCFSLEWLELNGADLIATTSVMISLPALLALLAPSSIDWLLYMLLAELGYASVRAGVLATAIHSVYLLMWVLVQATQSGMSELPSCTDLKHPISLSLLLRLKRIGAVEDCSVTLGFTAALLVAGHVVRQQKLQNAAVSSGRSSINLPPTVYLHCSALPADDVTLIQTSPGALGAVFE
ncbi:hypothetical protein Nepgr_030084 [Nepenthes gracilis]|uniref:Uncharacterized protein n=1 Tax=Nepenthes gracilis TaxID=150966 RepID=A0AAD3TFJ3_NEPGR|nr:hypothetical protein Nepgr_030084 [Nepenthes gracilis]